MSLLLLENLVKEFVGRGGEGIVRAVDQANISIEEGEFVTLLGPSGCGKTTALRIIAGFQDHEVGEVRIDGRILAGPGQVGKPRRFVDGYVMRPAVFDFTIDVIVVAVVARARVEGPSRPAGLTRKSRRLHR